MSWLACCTGLLLVVPLAAWEDTQPLRKSTAKAVPAPAARAGISGAAALRNENVQVNHIDNEALKESNIRLGDNVTLISQPVVELNYYATEHGRPPGELVVSRPVSPFHGWHWELYDVLKNHAAVSKQFRFGGRGERAVMLRAEAFNLANHQQFCEPQRNLSSPAFGKITNTLNDGRVLQVGARFTF